MRHLPLRMCAGGRDKGVAGCARTTLPAGCVEQELQRK